MTTSIVAFLSEKFLFRNEFHRFSDEGGGASVKVGAGALVAERGAEFAGARESCKKPVEVLHENRRGATFGSLLLDVGEVGVEERLSRGGAGVPGDDLCWVVTFRADIPENSFVGIVQKPRILVCFATDHHAVQILQLFFDLVERLDATVDAQVQLRHFRLEAVDELPCVHAR